MTRRLLVLLAASLAAGCSESASSTPPTPLAKPVILAPRDGDVLGAAQAPGGNVSFSGTATPGSSVVVESGPGVCSTTATVLGAWQCTATMSAGVHQVRAVATSSNNVSPFSDAVTFTLDLTGPPPPVFLSPTAGAHLSLEDLVAGQIAVSGTAGAGAVVDVSLDGAFVGSVVATGGAWSVQATVAEGSHTASARARDPLGNVSGTASAPFTLSLARQASVVYPPALPVPVTTWGETVADGAGLGEVFAGQADYWAIDQDFSFHQSFASLFSNALLLGTGTPTQPPSVSSLLTDFPTFAPFPFDQTALEVRFLSPRFTAADGVVTAAASDGVQMAVTTISGARSGFLSGTSDSRLSQTISGLDPAAVTTFTWTHAAFMQVGYLAGSDADPFEPRYQVVLRDATGTQLGDPLFVSTTDVVLAPVSVGRFGVPAQVVLSFELHAEANSYVELDDVSVDAGGGPALVPNGGFEGSSLDPLDPWVASSGAESQNVRSGVRPVGAPALSVSRTIYAPPAAGWARVVDVFDNEGAATVATSAVYETVLSALDPLAIVTAGGAAVVGWDGSALKTGRDVGIVVGNGTAYVDNGALTAGSVFVVHDLVVPPGGKVAIVQFVVQLGGAEGGATADLVPPLTAAKCVEIVAGFPSNQAYWQDLEPGVMHAIRNF
jgi:hypothetical protein